MPKPSSKKGGNSKKKGGGGKGRGGKFNVKLANKKTHRDKKSRPKKDRKRKRSGVPNNTTAKNEPEDPRLEDYLRHNPVSKSFVDSVQYLLDEESKSGEPPRKKRKGDRKGKEKSVPSRKPRGEEENIEGLMSYEKGIRRRPGANASKNFVSSSGKLPIKIDGVLMDPAAETKPNGKSKRMEVDEPNGVKRREPSAAPKKTAPVVPLTAEQRRQRRETLKEACANLCMLTLGNPEQNLKKLKNVERMCGDDDSVVSQLAMISLVTVYRDLLNGVGRIREKSHDDVKVSAAFQATRNFEKALLHHYKNFVRILFKNSSILKRKPKNVKESQRVRAVAAVGCLGKLLTFARNFNMAKEIIRGMVPLTNHRINEVRKRACKAIGGVFKDSQVTASTLELVRVLAGFIERKGYKVKPEVIRCFSKLGLYYMASYVARGERKTKKDKELEKGLEQNDAEQDSEKTRKTQTEIVKEVFGVYFFILKLGSSSALLPAVLEGLAEHAHLVNVELVVELVSLLSEQVTELKRPESAIRCILAALRCLEGRGQAIEFDLHVFYERLYEALWELVHPGRARALAPLVLECLDLMLRQRKQLSVARVGAFAKRALTVSVHLQPDQALALCHAVRGFVSKYPRLDGLLTNDCRDAATFYRHDVSDPDHANGTEAILWELPGVLSKSNHPFLNCYAQDFTSWADLPMRLSTSSPEDLLREFSCSGVRLNPGIKTPAPFKKRKGSRPSSILAAPPQVS